MIKLVVGLGNPGEAYKNTPHNAGWHVIDRLAARFNSTWKIETRFSAMTTSVYVADRNIAFIKPLTYMNLSGSSVGLYAQKNGVEPDEILVISDELAFPTGTVRLREGGSHNGHNGLRNIAERIGTTEFARVRVGIMAEGVTVSGDNRADYVLSKLHPKAQEEYLVGVELAVDAVEFALRNTLTAAMNRFNVKGKNVKE